MCVYVCFFPVWFYVGMAGAFCFILIQLVLLIDFAHSWNESWVEKMEEGNSRCWYAGKLFSYTLFSGSWTLKRKEQICKLGKSWFLCTIFFEEVFPWSLWVASYYIVSATSLVERRFGKWIRNIPNNRETIKNTLNG